MNKIVGFGLAAAAVVILTVIGIQLIGGSNFGGPPPPPSSSADPSTGSPTSPATPRAIALVVGSRGPGQFLIGELGSYTITITVPAGWGSLGGVPYSVSSADSESPWVDYLAVNDLFADPCDPTHGLRGVGPTADDLVAALSTYPGLTVDGTTAVLVSGYRGTRVQITSTDVDCGSAETKLWTGPPIPGYGRAHPGGGKAVVEYTIVTIGGERLVIARIVPLGAPPERIIESEAIRDSTLIEAR
jgi:hypothetical protein